MVSMAHAVPLSHTAVPEQGLVGRGSGAPSDTRPAFLPLVS